MDLKGKIKVFPELKTEKNAEGKDESFIVFRGTISSKKEGSEDYLNKSVSVRFAGNNFPRERMNKANPEKCYDLEIEEGFLAVRELKNNKRELEIVVLKGKMSNPQDFKRPAPTATADDLPF